MDVQVKILRPVAVPPRFLGAPRVLGATFIVAWMLAAMILFASKDLALFGVFCILGVFPTHFVAMWIGTREPHMDTLMRTWNLMNKTTRIIGKPRTKYYAAG